MAVLLLSMLLQNSTLKAQVTLSDSVSIPGLRYATLDDLGNTYILQKDNTISLIKRNGQKFTFNEKSLGKVEHIDPSNPLKILVHYSDANTLLFLDNTLSEIGRINLGNLDVYGMNVVLANSKLSGFWLFNPVQLNISRYDNDGKRLSSNQLNHLLSNDEFPKMLLEKNGRMYMSVSTGRLLVFDINGSYLFQLKTPGIDRFRVEGNTLYYFNQNVIVLRDVESVVQKELTLPRNLKKGSKSIISAQCGSRMCLVALKNKLLFYEHE